MYRRAAPRRPGGGEAAHPRRDDRRIGAARCGGARRDAWRCGALPMYQEHSRSKSSFAPSLSPQLSS